MSLRFVEKADKLRDQRSNPRRDDGPLVHARCTTTRSNVTGDGTQVTDIFDIKDIDTHSAFTLSTSTFTAPQAGYYQISGVLNGTSDANATGCSFTAAGSGFNASSPMWAISGATPSFTIFSVTLLKNISATTFVLPFNVTLYMNTGASIQLGYMVSGTTKTRQIVGSDFDQVTYISIRRIY